MNHPVPGAEVPRSAGGSVGVAPSPGDAPLLGPRIDPGGAGVTFGAFDGVGAGCAVQLLDPVTTFPMRPVGGGYLEAWVPGIGHGERYRFVLADGRVIPETFARFLPDGVHGPAMVVEPRYKWRHGLGVTWPLSEQVIYELHVGTFSERGDYQGARERLPELAELGITTVELMPLAAFAGTRGWGYDGVAPFAPFAPYGAPDELRALVDEAHGLGLSMLLDVVYNHFGPSGNYLPVWCADCFTSGLPNAWGDGLNYAHPLMRRLVLESARYWLTEFRFDGLRLDATHAILDPSSDRHVLRDLSEQTARARPGRLLVAEDVRNDSGLVTDFGMDAVWADDFHHQLAVTMTGERDGYYASYQPGAAALAQTVNRGWLYEGQTHPGTGKPRGRPADEFEAPSFVYCLQNHDQVGNRAMGERLSALVSPDQYRAASTLLLFLPMTPLLFMGQEWAAATPFQFFTDHEPELGRLISQGRREEFGAFKAFSDPHARTGIPDPQDRRTFLRSKLAWEERERGEHARVLRLYRTLLALRRSDPVLRHASRRNLWARAVGEVLIVERTSAAGHRCLVVNLSPRPASHADLSLTFAPAGVPARVIFASDGARGPRDHVPPQTAVILGTDVPG